MRSAFVLALVLSLPAVARADSAQACFDAAVDGQKQRDAGKLLAARERFIACAKGCPEEVQKDCAKWLTDVDAALPTVVFGARDNSGHDLLDVRVSVDGTSVGNTSQGKPIPLDPGTHNVRFEREGAAPIERTLVVRVGEKNRSVVAEFVQVQTAAPSVPTATWILGGVGVVGLGVFAYFGANGLSDYRRFGCDVGCAPADKRSVDTQFRIADVGLVIGVASLAAATIVWVVRPKSEVAMTPLRGGTFATLTVRF
jgi:hypothetical protein